LGESPISEWLRAVIDIHEDYINNRIQSIGKYFELSDPFDLKDKDNSVLEAIRYVSPY